MTALNSKPIKLYIETERLVLRSWTTADLSLFVAMNNDKRVMQRIGMIKVGEFAHPKLSAESPLRTHVLYRIDFERRVNQTL